MNRCFLLGLVALGIACGDDSGPGPEPDAGDADAGPGDRCRESLDCNDGMFCNGMEQCRPDDARADRRGCTPGDPVDCDDALDCTTDSCSEEERACRNVGVDGDGDGHVAVACAGPDCDDTDPAIFPGAEEVCDDARRDEDCDPETVGDRDLDADGHVAAECCNGAACGDDCNDFRRGVHPGVPEVCNGGDEDCNGLVDDGVQVMGFADEDRDLHGDPGMPLAACPFRTGFSLVEDDCADASAVRHAAQVEVCDMVDNDCDGTIDEAATAVTWYRDSDGDGFGRAESGVTVSCVPVSGYSLLAGDCNDALRGRSPAAVEVCNAVDDDCNGLADGTVSPGDGEDDDGDGFPDARCPGVGTDCEDDDPESRPGAPELDDGLDNDCDGAVDDDVVAVEWYVDADDDGYGDDSMPAITSAMRQPGRTTRGGDPDDSDASRRPTGADSSCDGVDDDGDAAIDEDANVLQWFADTDGDGFGVAATTTLSCTRPLGYAGAAGDCAPADALVFPGATERCNSADDDCNGTPDDGASATLTVDGDGDGHGLVGGATITGCAGTPGYAAVADDCDDGAATVYPGAPERCDLVDNDCDGMRDEGADVSMTCMLPGATATCTAGMCGVMSCTAPFLDCDGAPSNGCEVDPRANPAHCGMCGRACAPADTCTGGTCDASTPIAIFGSGADRAHVIRSTGGALGFGDSAAGEIGDGSSVRRATFQPVALRVPVVEVASGVSHTCFLTSTGDVWCSGSNTSAQLGRPTTELTGSDVPLRVPGLSGIAEIGSGQHFSCARTTAGEIRCWGARSWSSLGDGSAMTTSPQPTPVVAAGPADYMAMHVGLYNVCAVRRGGEVRCWGYSTTEMNGDGMGGPHLLVPTVVPGLPPDVVGIGDGVSSHTCVRTSRSELWCWGHNGYSQTGGSGSAVYPARVGALTNVVDVAFGGYATYATLADGSVIAFGYDAAGLGGGTPRPFPAAMGARDVAGGGFDVYVLDATGRVLAFPGAMVIGGL